MPIYVYECLNCKARKEKLRPRADMKKPLICPSCGGTMEHRLSRSFNWSRAKGWGLYGNRPGYAEED